jgi:hypothetical protein
MESMDELLEEQFNDLFSAENQPRRARPSFLERVHTGGFI